MKAIEITATGGADVLVLHDLSEPVAGPGQAVIHVEAAGVNFIDVYVREGRYPAKLPLVPGQEAAGTVTAVGDGVTTVAGGGCGCGDQLPDG
jgi:NADPH:quinone reductase